MAMKETFHVEVEKDLRGCVNVLKSVACEWLLIFFLLVDAVYLYFLKKFAKYCNLKLPCMLCSRLDHIFGNEKPDFYKDLICNEHRSKLSSLVFCHNHGSLADVHDVCEECLLSFATKKDSSPEIYKFLIGKLGLDGLRNPTSESDFFNGYVSVKSCSCCNKQWRCRPNVQKIVKSQSFATRGNKPGNLPLPSTAPKQEEKHLNRKDAVVKTRDKFAASAVPHFLGFHEQGDSKAAPPQVVYSKLKNSADSAFVFSEEDDGKRVDGEVDKLDHRVDQQPPGFSFKKQFEDRFATKKVISPTNMASDVLMPQQPDVISKPLKENHDFDDNHPLGSKFISSRGSIEPPGAPKSSLDKQDDKVNGDTETWEAFDLVTPKSRDGDGDEGDKKDGITLTSLHSGYSQSSKRSTKSNDSLGKAPKQPPDPVVRKDQNGTTKKANSNSSSTQIQVSTSSDDKIDVPFRFKVNGYVDEPYKDIKVSQTPPSYDRCESDISLSDFDDHKTTKADQNLIAQLRKEIEEGRETIDMLRMELEEERSAAAEAANQAMAMITKLQEEKAVLNMDAQQYLRMMEEQAEHDMEALENMNDLLAEKEKDIQDFEAELEFYRIKYPGEYEEEFEQAELISQSLGLGMVGGTNFGLGFPSSSQEKLPVESP